MERCKVESMWYLLAQGRFLEERWPSGRTDAERPQVPAEGFGKNLKGKRKPRTAVLRPVPEKACGEDRP